jgi:hypothetical protein
MMLKIALTMIEIFAASFLATAVTSDSTSASASPMPSLLMRFGRFGGTRLTYSPSKPGSPGGLEIKKQLDFHGLLDR